jgi:hypothetical protein
MYTFIVGNFLLEGYANGGIYVRRPGQGSPELEIASPLATPTARASVAAAAARMTVF